MSNNILNEEWIKRENYFDYDNSNFLNALKDRGFIIGKDSRSNYPRSYASILSTLNSSYIISSSDIKKKRELVYGFGSHISLIKL